MNNKNHARVPYQQGKLKKAAFVFSCPGQAELKAGCVCAGQTGKNLTALLKYCNEKMPEVFESENKEDYLITNASEEVHYKKLTNDTEASVSEIKSHNNLLRLERELADIDIVISMGKKAEKIECIGAIRVKQIKSRHLGMQSLNRINVPGESPAIRTEERIKKIGDGIIAAIKEMKRL